MDSERVRKAVAAYYAATRNGDREAWVATFAPNGQSRLFEGAPARGHTALRRLFRGLIGAFDSLGLTEECVSVNAPNAVVQWTARATTRRGTAVRFTGVDAFEVGPDGRILVHWSCWDADEVLSEL
jgi:hypothetical protein